MTFIEAIKCGMPFRRSGRRRWLCFNQYNRICFDNGDPAYLHFEDYIANDWEVSGREWHRGWNT
jgi:hypothetical protein